MGQPLVSSGAQEARPLQLEIRAQEPSLYTAYAAYPSPDLHEARKIRVFPRGARGIFATPYLPPSPSPSPPLGPSLRPLSAASAAKGLRRSPAIGAAPGGAKPASPSSAPGARG